MINRFHLQGQVQLMAGAAQRALLRQIVKHVWTLQESNDELGKSVKGRVMELYPRCPVDIPNISLILFLCLLRSFSIYFLTWCFLESFLPWFSFSQQSFMDFFLNHRNPLFWWVLPSPFQAGMTLPSSLLHTQHLSLSIPAICFCYVSAIRLWALKGQGRSY
jgi:hypothetical protein